GCGLGKEFRNSYCYDCYKDYYKDTEGNTDCIKCPRHKQTSISGATSVSDCNV
ncbi:multiple epidermal growth factor domains protein 6, partial [Biomphalaria glabrata]